MCCAVLCCAVLCCAVLCCAMLCFGKACNPWFAPCLACLYLSHPKSTAGQLCCVCRACKGFRDVLLLVHQSDPSLAKATHTSNFMFVQVQEGCGIRQEADRQHVATTAAVQVHSAAGDASGGQHTAPITGPGGRADWQQPLQEQDPVSPASSSGSALDPQLFRSACGSVCQAVHYRILFFA